MFYVFYLRTELNLTYFIYNFNDHILKMMYTTSNTLSRFVKKPVVFPVFKLYFRMKINVKLVM